MGGTELVVVGEVVVGEVVGGEGESSLQPPTAARTRIVAIQVCVLRANYRLTTDLARVSSAALTFTNAVRGCRPSIGTTTGWHWEAPCPPRCGRRR